MNADSSQYAYAYKSGNGEFSQMHKSHSPARNETIKIASIISLNAAARMTRSNAKLESRPVTSDIIFSDPVSQQLLEQLEKFGKLDGCKTDSAARRPLKHILLCGERGVGKELYAKFLHDSSNRCDEKFFAFNLAALSKELAISTLFGHKKGAFTGANSDHQGLIKNCENGTLFLDELDETDSEVQAMLKRVVEYGVYTPIGSNEENRSNVRFVFATNRTDLASGSIKADLLDRFWTVNIPPLRARRGDIKFLAQHFALQFGRVIEETALNLLENYDFPGNVRELKNLVERACVNSENKINRDAIKLLLPVEQTNFQNTQKENECQMSALAAAKLPEFSNDKNLDAFLAEIENLMIEKALANNNHNQTKAAAELGLSRTGLIRKLKRLNTKKTV